MGRISLGIYTRPTPVFLPRECHGLRQLVGYSPWSHRESDRLRHFHFFTVYTIMCKRDARGKLQYLARELSSVLCDDLEGWDGRCGVGVKRERIYVYIELIHVAVQQKLKYCKTTISQFLKNE